MSEICFHHCFKPWNSSFQVGSRWPHRTGAPRHDTPAGRESFFHIFSWLSGSPDQRRHLPWWPDLALIYQKSDPNVEAPTPTTLMSALQTAHSSGSTPGRKCEKNSSQKLQKSERPHREALDAFVLARGDREFAVLLSTCAAFTGHPWSSLSHPLSLCASTGSLCSLRMSGRW